jgi:predicted phosphate transport protein (TIGR00153 family)
MVHLLDWFSKKKKNDVLERSLEHLKKVVETVEALYNAVKNLDDRTAMKQMLHIVAQKEHEADIIRRQLTLDIVKGNLIFVGYEDMLRFVYKTDSIADWAHTADRYLALFEGKFTEEVKTRLLQLTEIGLKATRKLYEVVEGLTKKSKEEVFSGCSEIETLEEIADDEKRELLRAIFKSGYSVSETIILRDLAESIEDICDLCEIVADQIKILLTEME